MDAKKELTNQELDMVAGGVNGTCLTIPTGNGLYNVLCVQGNFSRAEMMLIYGNRVGTNTPAQNQAMTKAMTAAACSFSTLQFGGMSSSEVTTFLKDVAADYQGTITCC